MKPNLINTAIISNNPKRLLNLKLILSTPQRKLFTYDFKAAFEGALKSEVYDLVVFDTFSEPAFDFKTIILIRKEKLHKNTPFLFILGTDQQVYKMEIYKDEDSSFLVEPAEKFEILNAVKMLENIGQLNKRLHIYNDVLKSEKQLVNHMDQLLQINAFSLYDNMDQAFFDIQNSFVHKIELMHAVEKVIYLFCLDQGETLQFNIHDKIEKKLKQKILFGISNSVIKNSLINNTPLILEGQELLDPFVQELEETIGFEINSLLFIPLNLFHKPHSGFALINKIYRHNFSENDISLSLLTAQKLVFHLESIHLKKMGHSNLDDIIRSKTAGEIPKKGSELYKSILESISFGLILFDQEFRINFMNKFALDTFEVEPEYPTDLSALFGEDAFLSIKNAIHKNQLPLLRQEVMIIRIGAQNLDLGYSVYPIIFENKEQFALTFMEISYSKHIQSEIIRMDRMASLGVLASGIAHEIRNPLAGIKAMAQTLEEELEGEPAKIEYSQRIVRQVNRLDKLLKSFFSYAKPQRPDPIKCEISEIIAEVMPLFERSIKEKNITINEIYSPRLKQIYVDPHQIQQVFFNLIINAIQAMEKNGVLTIKARLPEETHPIIDRRQRIPKLFSDIFDEITISDTGCGMDQNTMKNIFNPFFTTKSMGTGMGLSIAYQIIREHGGQINVESEISQGTTFKILLPVYIDKNN